MSGQGNASKAAPVRQQPSGSLPPPPSTTTSSSNSNINSNSGANRQQSPGSHAAAASTLAALARLPHPSTPVSSKPASSSASSSNSGFNARSSLSHSLYSNAASSSSASGTGSCSNSASLANKQSSKSASGTGAGSPLKREVDVSTTPSRPSHSPSTVASASSTPAGKNDEGSSSKRKKANRACSHCQKAHLTCDDSRPCQRCVKKGLAETCTDGFRKKAKYLLDDEELEELKRQKEAKKAAKAAAQQQQRQSNQMQQGAQAAAASQVNAAAAVAAQQISPNTNPATTANINSIVDQVVNAASTPSSGHGPSPHHPQDLLSSAGNFDASSGSDPTVGGNSGFGYELNFDTSMHNFGSEATSLEYSILSSMLNGSDLQLLGPSGASPDFQTSPAVGVMDGWNIADANGNLGSGLDAILSGAGASGENTDVLPGLVGMDTAAASYSDTAGLAPAYATDNPSALQELNAENGFSALEVPSPKPVAMDEPMPQAPDAAADPANNNGGGGIELGSASQRSASNEPVADINKAIASRRYARQQQDTIWRARIAKTYRDNTAPFPYPEGYHFLIKYVTSKFEKSEVLRIVRALAIFRPSLIALQMPLTEEDECFVERSFQRTLLEFEKLISFSGTPTVVWRRTCEICVVGAEFCMLTQWSRDQLMGRRIYEFMDKNSTLDYWEKFALHAFENTTQSVMTTCTLVKPDGKLVPCAWSFTIKRDIFDLPSLVVGNFLPILS